MLTLKELNAFIKSYRNEHDWLNYRSAQICVVMANAWRGKGVRAFTVNDFMPGSHKRSQAQTPEQILANVKMLNAAFGGRVLEE